MKFLILAALPALVAAQYGPPSPDPATSASSASSAAAATPSAGPGQHIVQVGMNNGLVFTPNNLTVPANETVTFMFNVVSGTIMHSVTQSTFANPCQLATGGFDSGLQPAGSAFTITITNASQPIWFFCQQSAPAKHCNAGMVGGINVPSTGPNALSNFVVAATTASDPLQTASGILTGIGAVATAPAAPASAASSSSPSASASTKPSSAGKLVAGAGSLLAGLFTVVYSLA